jgi:NADH-quinone oxidoreductase subunit L
MFRLYFSIFWKKDASTSLSMTHSEGTLTMKIPLVILGAGALLVGYVPFSNLVTTDGVALESSIHIAFSIAPVLLALGGIALAANLYMKENARPDDIAASLSGLYQSAHRKFYIDEIYLFITKKIIFNLVGRPAAWFDRNIVDGFMNLLATVTGEVSVTIKGVQSGRVQSYAIYFFGGIIGLTILFLYMLK